MLAYRESVQEREKIVERAREMRKPVDGDDDDDDIAIMMMIMIMLGHLFENCKLVVSC